MKILVFDIGGTAIKYGICQDGHLEKTKECPTEAFKGGPHILNTVCSLAEQYLTQMRMRNSMAKLVKN